MRTARSRVLVRSISILLATAASLLAVSCGPSDNAANVDEPRPAGSDGWLTGDTHQKFETIADQLGGFDQTMIEVQYRYTNIYWAGIEENWEYVLYQIEELRESLERGYIRRPARRRSSEMFFNTSLANLEQTAGEQDPELFIERFGELTRNCNACHAMEGVRFIVVREPSAQPYPVGRMLDNTAE
jgi:hypothetical protein